MNSAPSTGNDKNNASSSVASASGGASGGDLALAPKASRHTKFFSNTVGRLRSHTVASEGNQLDEAMSPTAHANPYFAHQGLPGLRHHNAGSVPPSPPDTPTLKISRPDGTTAKATTETREELARRLRRVASAPNTQGLFTKHDLKSMPTKTSGDRPATAELGKDPLVQSGGLLSLQGAKTDTTKSKSPSQPDVLADMTGLYPPTALAFRRTYSSNSIKVKNVEVGPSSFDKIKMIGKGDVGKVYLVREKKSSRLYAMKGKKMMPRPSYTLRLTNNVQC